MDIKEKLVTFSSGGIFTNKNCLMDVPQTIIATSGKYKSGKIIDITVVIEGVNKKPSMDLLFFPEDPKLEISVGSKLILPFTKLKNCSGRIQILSEDFSDVGGCAVASLFNLNMTFLIKELYMITVYQGDRPFEYTKDCISLNIGYELGNCG